MKYDASQIKLKNIPDLEQLEDGKCCRTYIYCFTNLLPEQNVIEQIANSLEKRFTFSKEVYEIPEDVEICASIFMERLQDDEARVRVLTDQPEEVLRSHLGDKLDYVKAKTNLTNLPELCPYTLEQILDKNWLP